jgi:hypothetical protein
MAHKGDILGSRARTGKQSENVGVTVCKVLVGGGAELLQGEQFKGLHSVNIVIIRV